LKVNRLLAPWKGDKRFTAISARGAALKKAGGDEAAILAAIEAEFGAPARLEQLREQPQPYAVFGEVGEDIELHALQQLELALRLPVAAAGALMPDAHPGYALPVGGVFAAHNAVSPAMVGVDIGCRMHLSIYAEPPEELLAGRAALLADLGAVTYFGTGAARPRPGEHAVLDDERWALTSQLRGLRERAVYQIGTSGSGNHFAELVVGERLDGAGSALPAAVPQRFCGLLTHSGSRGIGYSIANAYMRLAAQETAQRAKAPKLYEWLDLTGAAGQEYWQAMELAGAFAQACHELIHAAFARRSRLTPLAVVQNHHNFAWRKGELVVHRKGATPAEAGVLGVIPGSMAAASYLVEGLGNPEALESAAHGAGRRGSRWQARSTIGGGEVRRLLREQDVLVEGLSLDEAPQAYKDIERVMALQVQAGLVRTLARMRPVAVIMAGEQGDD
jgi:tRNA-splicing ligase RtcB